MEQEKMTKFNKLFPWYAGLSSDLLFWVAIDTLFLTVVKQFSVAQIASLTTVSLISCMVLQVPLLTIIKKIGNTKSVRLGSLFLLISSLLLTFGPNYIVIALGKIIYEIGLTLQNMANVVLKNNLELQNKSNDYIRIKTKSNSIYATITMLISFIASLMFNLNHYFPMFCCIAFCIICFFLSFFITDFSKYDKIKEETKRKVTSNFKLNYSKPIVLLILSFGLFFCIVSSGQSEGKLFIQQELFLTFDVDNTSFILGGILCISRIVRVISNLFFNKIHNKYQEKVGIFLPLVLSLSIGFLLLGAFIPFILLKFAILTLGYILLLFIRDPFKVYLQDLALENTKKENHQTLLTLMDLSRKIQGTIISLSFTMILTTHSMIIVILLLLILSFIEIGISVKLYKLIANRKQIEAKNTTETHKQYSVRN